MKLLSLFSGIGAFEKALTRAGIDYDLVGFSEIDKYAIESYCAIHNVSKDKCLGDISQVDLSTIEEVDMIVGGSPCQDFSVAGKQQGSTFVCRDCGHEFNPLMVEPSERDFCKECDSEALDKTRSSLLIEYIRCVRELRPKYIVYENVKNIIGKKFKEGFNRFIEELELYGYTVHYKVLNSKNYGIPQNRERVFVVGIIGEDDEFSFPKEFDNGIRLKDVLESEVDERYYIEEEKTKTLIEKLKKENSTTVYKFQENNLNQVGELDMKGNEQIKRVYGSEGISPTLTTMGGGNTEPKILEEPYIVASRGRNPKNPSDRTVGTPTEQRLEINKKGLSNTLTSVQKDNWVLEPKVKVKEATKKGYDIATVGDSINVEFPSSKTRRGRVGKQVAQTLNTACNQATLERDYRIRKLTPKECWSLMGFDSEDYTKAKTRLEETFYKGKDRSNSQMYKQAGNSIVVDVLEHIFNNLLHR